MKSKLILLVTALSLYGCSSAEKVQNQTSLEAETEEDVVEELETYEDSNQEINLETVEDFPINRTGAMTLKQLIDSGTEASPVILFSSKGALKKDGEIQEVCIFENGTVRNAFFTIDSENRPTWGDVSKMSDAELVEWLDNRPEMKERTCYEVMINTDDSGNAAVEEMILTPDDHYYFLPNSTSGTIYDSNYYGLKRYTAGEEAGWFVRANGDLRLYLDSPGSFDGLIDPSKEERANWG